MASSIVHDSRTEDLPALTLLELDEHVLAELLAEGRPRVVLRGPPDGDAHLCTPTRTYVIKEAEISNQLLVLHRHDSAEAHGDGDVMDAAAAEGRWFVRGRLKGYLELTAVVPKWDRLVRLLGEAPYAGDEGDARHDFDMTLQQDSQQMSLPLQPGPRRYTLADLLGEVSASEAELRQALAERDALEIDGHWRVLKFEYMCQLMDTLKSVCEGHNWGFRAIPDGGIVRSMQNVEAYPPQVVRHCLRLWAEHAAPVPDDQGEAWWRLSPEKVCRFYGLYLLQSLKKVNDKQSLPLSEFMTAWTELVPEDMRPPRQEMLNGFVLKSTTPIGVEYLRYFPRTALPTDPRDRFERLFAEQARWTLDEIAPFLADLAPDVKQRDALLLKHARSSTAAPGRAGPSSGDGAVKVYTNRYI